MTRVIAADGDLAEAVDLLRRGDVVAIPTETVYGLAANALDAGAVAKVYAAKGRPQDNPLICHIASLAMLPMVARPMQEQRMPDATQALMDAFWPGPLTLILAKADAVPDVVSCGLGT
eukprot:gene10203-9025_t